MAKKTRTKKYAGPKPQKIPAIIPLESVADVHPIKAAQLHAALITLIARPNTEHCNNLTRQLCVIAGGLSHARGGKPIMQDRDASAIAVQSAILTIEAIIDRTERTGVLAVLEQEAKTLRTAAGRLDDALATIPINCYHRAEIEVEAREAIECARMAA